MLKASHNIKCDYAVARQRSACDVWMASARFMFARPALHESTERIRHISAPQQLESTASTVFIPMCLVLAALLSKTTAHGPR